MRRLFILLIILVFSLNIGSVQGQTNINSLEDIISYSNSEIVRKEIFTYGYFESEENIENLINNILHNHFKDKTFTLNSNSERIYAEYKDESEAITISLSNVESSKSSKYISIFYSHNDIKKNIINLRDNISQIITLFDDNPRIYTQIIGKINGNLNNSEISSVISHMLSASSVSFQKDYDDSSVSFSGYTNKLKSSLNIDTRKINIQSAGKYSSTDDCTYIWIGNPIIPTEY